MAWKHLLQITLGSALVLAQAFTHNPPSDKSSSGVAVEEILSYECARSIATIVTPSEQTGPLFADGRLIFTSLEAQDSSLMLLVNAGYGNFVINLERNGVNRIRFEIPSEANAAPRTFFLSYMHGGVLRSRYFEYAEEHAPAGRDELDYSLVNARRADNLVPHLDYAIHETAEATLSAITEGRVTRSQMLRHKVENCEHISRQSPSIAKNLRRSVDMLDLIVMGPKVNSTKVAGERMPASISK
jgi:hypothetical protein